MKTRDNHKLVKPTLKHIAQLAGVSISTVSDVLRNRTGKVKVSDDTLSRILKIAQELDYQPNSAAHTLVTGRTYNIGFLLSQKATLGFANYYFGTYLSGVQEACKERGYACVVSAYDLSSLEDLIIPIKIRKKNIDGVIITGYVENKVLDVLLKYNIPFILMGQIVDFKRNEALVVSRDMISEWNTLFEYLRKTGCSHIGVADIDVESVQLLLKKAISLFTEKYNEDVKFTVYKVPYSINQFKHAKEMAKTWLSKDTGARECAIVSHDQWCVGFLSEVMNAGIKVPDELSVVSTCDTAYCQYYNPQVSALSIPLFESAKDATYLLADYIEGIISFDDANKKTHELRSVGELIVRNSSV